MKYSMILPVALLMNVFGISVGSATQTSPAQYGPSSNGFEIAIHLSDAPASPNPHHKVVLIAVDLKNIGTEAIAVSSPTSGLEVTLLDSAGAPVSLSSCPPVIGNAPIMEGGSPEALAPGGVVTGTFDLGCNFAFQRGAKYTLSVVSHIRDALYTKTIAVLHSNTITFISP